MIRCILHEMLKLKKKKQRTIEKRVFSDKKATISTGHALNNLAKLEKETCSPEAIAYSYFTII